MKLGIVPERIAGRTSGTERTSRAHASHAEAGDGIAAGGAIGGRNSEPSIAFAASTTSSVRTRRWPCRPAAVYTPSPRQYPARVPAVEYPAACRCASVQQRGVDFSWNGHQARVPQRNLDRRNDRLAAGAMSVTGACTLLELPIACFDSRQFG